MKTLLLETATYIHADDRDMAAELAAVKPWRHDSRPKARPLAYLAAGAAAHYARLRQSTQRIQIKVHVFPVLPSGRGQSADFRTMLACKLAGVAYYPGQGDAWRRSAEKQARGKGFNFVEVNPSDWQVKP